MSRKSAIKFATFIRVCTDGTPSLFVKSAGTVALLELYFDRNILKCHCITHQECLCGHLRHVMISVVERVNKIRARGLNRREFREHCGLLDMQYDDLILHCEVRRLSIGQFLNGIRMEVASSRPDHLPTLSVA